MPYARHPQSSLLKARSQFFATIAHLEDLGYSLLVVLDDLVCDTVGAHNLRSAELVLGGVHLLSEEFVEGAVKIVI